MLYSFKNKNYCLKVSCDKNGAEIAEGYFGKNEILTSPLFEMRLKNISDGEIESDRVLSGAWRYRSGERTVIFAVNISEKPVKFKLLFNAEEYGIKNCNLPSEFTADGSECTIVGELARYEIKTWEINL